MSSGSLEEQLAEAEADVEDAHDAVKRARATIRFTKLTIGVLGLTFVGWIVLGATGVVVGRVAGGLTFTTGCAVIVAVCVALANWSSWQCDLRVDRRTLRRAKVRRARLHAQLERRDLSDAQQLINDFNRIHGDGTNGK